MHPVLGLTRYHLLLTAYSNSQLIFHLPSGRVYERAVSPLVFGWYAVHLTESHPTSTPSRRHLSPPVVPTEPVSRPTQSTKP